MADDIEGSFTDVIRDRFRNHFLAAFTIAACVENWKALYTLIRPNVVLTEKQNVLDVAYDNFEGLGWAVLSAIGFAIAFPVLHLLQGIFAKALATVLASADAWIEARRRFPVRELAAHPEYQRAIANRDGMRNYISALCQAVDPSRPEGQGITVYALTTPVKAPAFLYDMSRGLAGTLFPTSMDALDAQRVRFAFDTIGEDFAIAASHGAMLRWPDAFSNVAAYGLKDGQTVPLLEPVADNAQLKTAGYGVVVRRVQPANNSLPWAKFDVLKV